MLGDVSKRTVVIVPVQPVIKGLVLFYQTRNSSAIGKEDVEITVVVEIEEGDAAQRGINNRFVVGRTVIQDEPYLRLSLPVFESDRSSSRWPRSFTRPLGKRDGTKQGCEGRRGTVHDLLPKKHKANPRSSEL